MGRRSQANQRRAGQKRKAEIPDKMRHGDLPLDNDGRKLGTAHDTSVTAGEKDGADILSAMMPMIAQVPRRVACSANMSNCTIASDQLLLMVSFRARISFAFSSQRAISVFQSAEAAFLAGTAGVWLAK